MMNRTPQLAHLTDQLGTAQAQNLIYSFHQYQMDGIVTFRIQFRKDRTDEQYNKLQAYCDTLTNTTTTRLTSHVLIVDINTLGNPKVRHQAV